MTVSGSSRSGACSNAVDSSGSGTSRSTSGDHTRARCVDRVHDDHRTMGVAEHVPANRPEHSRAHGTSAMTADDHEPRVLTGAYQHFDRRAEHPLASAPTGQVVRHCGRRISDHALFASIEASRNIASALPLYVRSDTAWSRWSAAPDRRASSKAQSIARRLGTEPSIPTTICTAMVPLRNRSRDGTRSFEDPRRTHPEARPLMAPVAGLPRGPSGA
jgi:hypothetical protein